jgi:hypothetical protein
MMKFSVKIEKGHIQQIQNRIMKILSKLNNIEVQKVFAAV